MNKAGWDAIRAEWLSAYLNRETKTGLSVMNAVSASDEWCAEAYLETDYSQISQTDFEKVVRDYAVYRLLNSDSAVGSSAT